MGIEIPIVLGGFGVGQKCLSDRTIADIHYQPTPEIRRRISDNIIRFNENVDYLDLKKVMAKSHNNLLAELGYSQMQISKAEHIYILSERGYAKLIKIMDSDLAWEIHDKLIDEYFMYREEKQKSKMESTKRIPLSSVNMAARIMKDTYKEAGVDSTFIAVAVSNLYKNEAGIDFGIPLITNKMDMPKLYDCTEIAKELGIYSTSGNPHNLAVSAIIKRLHIGDSEIVTTAFSRNGHDDVTVQYKPSVYEDVKLWLAENNYPMKIPYTDSKGNTRTFTVTYKEVA